MIKHQVTMGYLEYESLRDQVLKEFLFLLKCDDVVGNFAKKHNLSEEDLKHLEICCNMAMLKIMYDPIDTLEAGLGE